MYNSLSKEDKRVTHEDRGWVNTHMHLCVVICNTLSWKIRNISIQIAYRQLYKYMYYERVRVFVPSVSFGAIAFICIREFNVMHLSVQSQAAG